MALEIKKQTAYGIDANYWRVDQISISRSGNSAGWQ